MLRYLGEHFRGRLPLALSFWVNFILLAAVLYAAGAVLHDTAAVDSRFLDALLAFLVLNTLIYAWQVCGVWRASENALLNHIWFPWARGAQTVVVLSILVYLGQVLGYAHLVHQQDPRQPAPDESPAYSLELSDDGAVATLRGPIDFGVTRELTRLLDKHESIRIVSLDSRGGRVSEARGLALLIDRHRLATYSGNVCSSACTQAYISGKRRILGPRGRLGFHRYRLDSPYASIFVDPDAEQRSDLAFFRSREVDPEFLERVLGTPSTAMWFPSHDELLAAGVVHEVRALR